MQPTTSAQALSQLQTAQSQAQDPNSILQAQDQTLGVNGAQQTVTGLRGAIDNTTKLLNQVAPSVMGRTGNSLVTNAQASKQIQNEQAPISQNLTTENTQYNNANTDLNQLQQEAQTAATGQYQGQQDKLSYAQNLYNTLYTQEQNAQAEKDKQAALAEQAREANLAYPALGSSDSSAGTAPPATVLTGGKSKSDAVNAVQSLVKSDPTTIFNTINAIYKSAGYGNTYDQAKLELLKSYEPGYFDKNGKPVQPLNVSKVPAGTSGLGNGGLYSIPGLTF